MYPEFYQTETQPSWLVVDDNVDILNLIHIILGCLTGVPVACFHSPEAALAAFAADPGKYGLVITDYEFNFAGGIVPRLLRRLPGRSVIKI